VTTSCYYHSVGQKQWQTTSSDDTVDEAHERPSPVTPSYVSGEGGGGWGLSAGGDCKGVLSGEASLEVKEWLIYPFFFLFLFIYGQILLEKPRS
jgi:hypothetical protein